MLELNAENSEFKDLSNQILTSGKSLRFRARGCSMFPFILNGDLLTVQSVAEQAIMPLDILMVGIDEQRIVTHRVIEVNQKKGNIQFLLQGDAADTPDGYFDPGVVLGRIVSYERRGRIILTDSRIYRVLARVWVTPMVRYLYKNYLIWNQQGRKLVRRIIEIIREL